MFDYCHLIKCFRNLHMQYDVIVFLPNGVVRYISWETHVKVYEEDKKKFGSERKLCWLKDEHIYYRLCPLMRVKYAVQVFSHKMAENYRQLAEEAGDIL